MNKSGEFVHGRQGNAPGVNKNDGYVLGWRRKELSLTKNEDFVHEEMRRGDLRRKMDSVPGSRAGWSGKPVAARDLVNGRGPRRQAWEGRSEAEGLPGTLPAIGMWTRRRCGGCESRVVDGIVGY